ncbi:MAG: glutathione S-transferase [SAR86 cluster bacterium]|uniref:Glutathione S-transferase n=1 Tax=SAR86 cluster bacterium TaxID=2030880 RepID=A0A2A5AHN9_9GAMM|nr:MAG: glutathione S-transferase [SAR86 cluster bacterium]
MNLKIYTVSGAPRGWRALLGMAFKGLDYEVKYLEASKGEHKASDFLAINPRGTVPVLEVDGVLIRDSLAILAWLDHQYPQHPLFGNTPEIAANIWQITTECNDYLRAAINDVFTPILVLGETLPESGTEKREELDAAVERLHKECRYLNNLLNDNCCFGSASPSAADAIIFPEISLVHRAIEKKHHHMEEIGLASFDKDYPQIEIWRNHIAAQEGVLKTMPIHWVT